MGRYSPLQDDHVRLLLLQRNPVDSRIQGSLKHYPLSEVPRYEALSYVWGAIDPRFELSCDGQTFYISPNLNTALHSIMLLTPADEKRTLWADQICINQEDEGER
jgi:hypothetical protein